MNYTHTPKGDECASGFIEICFPKEVLFFSPPLFSTVRAEIIFNGLLARNLTHRLLAWVGSSQAIN